MFCEKCGAELQGTATVCPECGERVAVRQQYTKFNELKKKPMEIMARSFKRPLFIIFAVLISLFTIVSAASVAKEIITFTPETLAESIVTLILLPISLICGIFATIGVWKCVANKGTSNPRDIVLIRPIMTCEKVYGVILAIPGFLLVVVLALAAFLTPTLVQFTQDNMASWPEEVQGYAENAVTQLNGLLDRFGNLFMVICLASAVFLAFLLILNIMAFSKSAEHWSVLKKAAKRGEYVAPAQVPFVSLLIYGVVWTVPSAILLFFGIRGASIAEMLLGVAIFVEALYFKTLHKAEQEIIKEIAQEKSILTNLIHQAEAEERQLRENQREAQQARLDELTKANQERQLMTDAQMQQMMQLMMANMAVNQVNQANQNHPAQGQDGNEIPMIEAEELAQTPASEPTADAAETTEADPVQEASVDGPIPDAAPVDEASTETPETPEAPSEESTPTDDASPESAGSEEPAPAEDTSAETSSDKETPDN